MENKCKFPTLSGLIIEKYGTWGAFARDLSITLTTLGRKMNGKSKWKYKEIESVCNLLEIEKSDIPVYFFSPQLAKAQA